MSTRAGGRALEKMDFLRRMSSSGFPVGWAAGSREEERSEREERESRERKSKREERSDRSGEGAGTVAGAGVAAGTALSMVKVGSLSPFFARAGMEISAHR